MEAPDFDSQSKTRLINESVGKIIKDYFDNEDAFKTLIRKSSDWINEIYDRCAQRTQKKDNRETARMSKKLLRGKVPDLRDAASKDRQSCILFLGEGESAISGFNNVRNSDYHGVLALQGKVVNVNGEQPRKILENSALSTIMASCGLTIGSRAIRNHMNYGKVYIATDADPDGLNIGALLINFFYSYWPELFESDKEAVFHIFMTPFVIARKGKQTKYWYSHNYSDFDPDKYKGWEITRAKGLAALLEDDWAYSLENPELYPVVDDGKMEESLDLIFNGKRADDRKDWIGL
jgi:DNA gyrase/topoisomerase IV subunit B